MATTIVTASDGSTTADLETLVTGCDSNDISTNGLVMSGDIDFSTSAITYDDIGTTYTFTEQTCDRLLGHNLLAPQWYIKVCTDINSRITFCDNHSTDHCDDAWAINAGVWQHTDTGYTKEYKLPNSSVTDIKLAEFNVCDETSTNHTYHLMADVTLSDQGVLSNTLDVVDSGEEVGGTFTEQSYTITEDVNKAQTAYFDGTVCDGTGGTPSVPGPNDADDLTATLTQAQVCDDRATGLSSVASALSGSILESWTITLNGSPLDTRTNLAKYARNKYVTSKNVFADNDLVVLDTPKLYTVTMNDIDSTPYTIANDYVYGVLKQTTS